MVGNRLGRTALSRPLRQWCDLGRSKALSHQTWTERFPRCRQANSVTLNFLSRTFCVGHGGRAGRTSTNFSLTGTQRAGEWRNRSQMAVGGLLAFIAAALLAREGYLPESFADWDDELVWEEVYDLAQLSNMATKSHSFITRWFDDRGYTGGLIVRDLIEASSRYILHVGHLPGKEQHRVHHIAIRGTVSLKELKANLMTRLVFDEECGCNLHEGIKGLSDAVADDIEQFLEPGAEIKICGHSLGGAIAVIVAAKLKLRGHKVGVAMTFGAPMVTDGPGAEHLRGIVPVLRVTHETDVIPLVPMTVVPPLLRLPIIAAREEGSSRDRKAFLRGRWGGEGRVVGGDMSDGSGRELESLDGDGVFCEKGGRGEREVGRSGYSHFGRQLVLLQRNRCMECRREEAAKSSSSLVESSRPHIRRRGTSGQISWDDIWGPPGSVSASPSPECKHCPSRGMTYYDTDSGQGSFFDSIWVRLPNIPYTHRMMYYEAEVASRMEHHNRSRNSQREEESTLFSPQVSSGGELPVPRPVTEQ